MCIKAVPTACAVLMRAVGMQLGTRLAVNMDDNGRESLWIFALFYFLRALSSFAINILGFGFCCCSFGDQGLHLRFCACNAGTITILHGQK